MPVTAEYQFCTPFLDYLKTPISPSDLHVPHVPCPPLRQPLAVVILAAGDLRAFLFNRCQTNKKQLWSCQALLSAQQSRWYFRQKALLHKAEEIFWQGPTTVSFSTDVSQWWLSWRILQFSHHLFHRKLLGQKPIIILILPNVGQDAAERLLFLWAERYLHLQFDLIE